jgi:hypothetical protein
MEIWKSVPGHSGYEVSDCGNVRSLDRKNKRGFNVKGKLLKQKKDKKGYLNIKVDNKQYKVHRLVMLTFEGESELQVNHKDCIKSNNNKTNLEYVTGKENMVHAFKNGLYDNAMRKTKERYSTNYKLKANLKLAIEKKKVKIYGMNIKSGYITKIFNSVTEAAELINGSQGTISICLKGIRKSAYGYIWKRVIPDNLITQ